MQNLLKAMLLEEVLGGQDLVLIMIEIVPHIRAARRDGDMIMGRMLLRVMRINALVSASSVFPQNDRGGGVARAVDGEWGEFRWQSIAIESNRW